MKRLWGTPLGDYLPAFALLLLTAVYLITAYRYAPDARAVPAGVAWTMLVLLGLDLLSRTRTRIGIFLMHGLNPAGEPEKAAAVPHYGMLRQLVAVLWVAALAGSMVLIGILYSVPLFVFLSMRLRGSRPLWLCAAVAAGACMMIWVLFTAVLHLELYPGILFGGA